MGLQPRLVSFIWKGMDGAGISNGFQSRQRQVSQERYNFLKLLQQVSISLMDVPAAPAKHRKRPLPKVQVLAAKPEVLKESGKINHFSGNRVSADLSPWPNNYQQLYLLPWPYLWRTTPTTASMPVPDSIWGENAMKAIMRFLPPISTPQMHK